ncbi:MAG TPA: protein kinase family protein [Ktedonosporobacter sp.]|jgi:serine/threonine protein kinase|nr:protein kinase family protein [Ktedonosporobacter sp.]
MGSNIYETREGTTSFCLGQPPHAVQEQEVICRICGALVAGAHLGIYQVQQLLGKGRSGDAYLASHLRSKQLAVLKLFPPDPACKNLWEAVRHEVRIITTLRHSSILPVFSSSIWYPDSRSSSSQPLPDLLAVPGRAEYLLTLSQYAPATLTGFVAHYGRSDGSRTPYEQRGEIFSRVLRLIQQAGSALNAAHERGIAHGSIVPGNILLDHQGHTWIADFGLARLHPPPQPYLAPEHYSVAQHSLRTANMAAYWEAVNPASDQFMLAILCQQVMTRMLHPSEYEPLLPVLQRATNQHPTHRFASIDTFVHELIGQATRGRGLVTTGPLRNSVQQTPTPHLWQQSGSSRSTSAAYPQYGQAAAYQLATPAIAAPIDDWEKRGDKLFTMRDYNGAVQAYRQALEANTGKATLWLALGDAYFALENHIEALNAYEQAVRLNPNDPLTWSNRGTVLDALGRHKEAVECYDRADQLR